MTNSCHNSMIYHRKASIWRAGVFFLLAVLLGLLLAFRADAADVYAAPAGLTTATGAQNSPLDLATAVGSKSPLKPGDTLWLEAGVYSYPFQPANAPGEIGNGFQVSLAGTAAAPITIRGIATATSHVVIDGGMALIVPSTHLIMRDMEITTLTPRPAGMLPADTSKLTIAWGGLNVFSGDGDKFIDLVIHGNCQGMSLWEAASNTEVEGCVVYGDGWQTAADGSGDGHEIYTQNIAATGTKLFDGNIIASGLSGYSFHAYGESGHVENYTVDHNVFLPGPGGRNSNVLIGGNLPSSGIVFTNNDIYHEAVILGWYAPYNEDCLVTGNTDMQPSGDEFDVKNYVRTTFQNNVIEGWGANIVRASNWTPPAGETWTLTASDNSVSGVDYMGFPAGWTPPAPLAGTAPHQIYAGYIQAGNVGSRPAAPTVHLIPDKYNPDRAIVDVLNWSKAATVSLDLSALLKPGDSFRLLNPTDLWGTPVASGTYSGPINVAPGEFAAYVLERDSSPVTLQQLAGRVTALENRVAALEGARMETAK